MRTSLLKDILIFIRDYKQLIVILLVPFVTIAILGFALRGVMSGNSEALHMRVALVQQDNEQQGVERFIQELEEMQFSEEEINAMSSAAQSFRPYATLQHLLNDEQLREIVDSVEMDVSEAELALQNNEVVAVLTVPENFTYHFLQKMLLDRGAGSEFQITVDNFTSAHAEVFHTIVSEFVRSANFETALTQTANEHGLSSEAIQSMSQEEFGSIETVSQLPQISSFQYYTLAQGVMFALIAISYVATKAYDEKLQHVFTRILLSGRHHLIYLSGKLVSTTLIVFVQLLFLFSLSALVFQSFAGKTLDFWLGVLLISAVLSLCIGAMATLLIALSFRFQSSAITDLFAILFVSGFAIVGGSIIPVAKLPEFVGFIGGWTPNGAALSAYVQWLQGLGMEALFSPLSRLVGITLLLLLASVLTFPQRRHA